MRRLSASRVNRTALDCVSILGEGKQGGQLRSAPIGSRLARLGLGLALQLHVVKFRFGLNCLGILV